MIKEVIIIVSCIGMTSCRNNQVKVCGKDNGSMTFTKNGGTNSGFWTFPDNNCASNCSQLLFRITSNKMQDTCRNWIKLELPGGDVRYYYRGNICFLVYLTSCFRAPKRTLNDRCDRLTLVGAAHFFTTKVTFTKTGYWQCSYSMSYEYIPEEAATTTTPVEETTKHEVTNAIKSDPMKILERAAQKDAITITALAVVSGVLFLALLLFAFRLYLQKSRTLQRKPLQAAESTYAEIQRASTEPQTMQNQEVFNVEVVANELYGMQYQPST